MKRTRRTKPSTYQLVSTADSDATRRTDHAGILVRTAIRAGLTSTERFEKWRKLKNWNNRR